MEKRTLEILIKAGKAVDEIESLKAQVEDLNKQVAEGNKATEQGLKDVKETAENTAKGFKGIGLAIKAAGIGIAVAAFRKLVEVFRQNQKVVDVFNTATIALRMAFGDFFKFLESNIGAVTGFFKTIFEDPKQSLIDLGNAIKANLIERVQSSLDALGFLGDAIVKVFKGDFEGAMESAKNAGKELVDTVTGVPDTFDKVSEAVPKVVKGIKEYTKSTIDSASSLVDFRKQAELAEVQNAKLLQQFDLQAEQQRQIRDEERNTIEERIEANNRLGAVLEEQEKLMLANADAQIEAAKAELALADNQENRIRLIQAETERADVLATVEGFRSEQKMNDLALDKEKLELTQSKIDAETDLANEQRRFGAEQLEFEHQRLEAMLSVFEQEYNAELTRLENKKSLYKEGTQAFQDAENEILALNQQFTQDTLATETQLAKAKMQLEDQVLDAKLGAAAKGLQLIGAIAKEGGEIAKIAAVAQATVEGVQSTISAYKTAAASPITTVFPAYPTIQAALAAGFAAVNIAKIKSTNMQSPQGGAASPTPRGAQAPAFNVVGAAPENQLAEAIGQQEQKPIKAFVVGSEVSNQQELDRNITEEASIG